MHICYAGFLCVKYREMRKYTCICLFCKKKYMKDKPITGRRLVTLEDGLHAGWAHSLRKGNCFLGARKPSQLLYLPQDFVRVKNKNKIKIEYKILCTV